MPGVIATEGCEDIIIAYSTVSPQVGLFSSPHTPVNGDTVATYIAIESAFPGYAQVSQIFGGISPDGSGGIEIPVGSAVFTATAANTEFAFGYFVYNPATGRLLGAELFPAPGPYDMGTTGTTLTVDVTLFEDPA